jgi:hypothetical protein
VTVADVGELDDVDLVEDVDPVEDVDHVDDVDAPSRGVISGLRPKAMPVPDDGADGEDLFDVHPADIDDRTIQRFVPAEILGLDYDLDATVDLPPEWLDYLALSARPSERSVQVPPAPETVPLLTDLAPLTPPSPPDLAPLRPSTLLAPSTLLPPRPRTPSQHDSPGTSRFEPSGVPAMTFPRAPAPSQPASWEALPAEQQPRSWWSSRYLPWVLVVAAALAQLWIAVIIARKLAVFFLAR